MYHATNTSTHMNEAPALAQVARGVNEGWSPSGESTDEGHIDWILRSDAPSVGGRRLKASRVAVCTEQLCPPLPPQQDASALSPPAAASSPRTTTLSSQT
eukprot:CAMPEP_0113260442 /NCGR_PEP_ID=MMETSP0008_2-20120614/16880_1 /TAXON_ID=97485 /ORGANISM="Prymnesium parvum" /LENGTH=99 /DNA_ID=CAMNT_0000109013 /DNA_START=284 /DNA_END=585 /DNA_ORIENTATION=- /assembly_acc=CAM_ASM_000153